MELTTATTPPGHTSADAEAPTSDQQESRRALEYLTVGYVVGLMISVYGIWIAASYLRGDPFSNISFNGVDATVRFPPTALGQHTFGDLWLYYLWALEDNPWAGVPFPNNYPPLAVAIVEPLSLLSYGHAMVVALGGIILSVVGTIWWSFRGYRTRYKIVATSLVLTSAPVLSVLDRGNSAGLLIVPLLVLALAWTRSRTLMAGLCLAIVASIKLYPALIALPMLATRRWLAVLIGGVLTVAWAILIWLWYPAPGLDELEQWRSGTTAFLSGHQSFTLQWNYSFSAGLGVLSSSLGVTNPIANLSPWVPGLVLLVILSVVLALRPELSVAMLTTAMAVPFLAVPISTRYTTVFAVVGVALLALSAGGYPRLPLVSSGAGRPLRSGVFTGALLLTLVPLVWPLGQLQLSQILIAGSWAIVVLVEAGALVLSAARSAVLSARSGAPEIEGVAT